MPDSDTLKAILRMFCYGLHVVTTVDSGGPRAATVSWVTQTSFEPKMLAVGLRKGTAICEAVQECRRFVLHVVGEHQPDFARAFFRSGRAGPDEIGGHRYSNSESGLPILGTAVAWMECEVEEVAGESGDHAIFIARALDWDIQVPGITALALRDTNWHYGG
jgi:flavin reductase (DIM6/NTAB) family NADH-FMN oxidoreductase RutF